MWGFSTCAQTGGTESNQADRSVLPHPAAKTPQQLQYIRFRTFTSGRTVITRKKWKNKQPLPKLPAPLSNRWRVQLPSALFSAACSNFSAYVEVPQLNDFANLHSILWPVWQQLISPSGFCRRKLITRLVSSTGLYCFQTVRWAEKGRKRNWGTRQRLTLLWPKRQKQKHALLWWYGPSLAHASTTERRAFWCCLLGKTPH